MWPKAFKEELCKLAFPEEMGGIADRVEGKVSGENLWEEDLVRAITKLNEKGDMNNEYLRGLRDELNARQRTA